MSRLSIEVTPEQHQRLKAIAALHGQTIREYVLERVLPSPEDELEALQELESFLKPRIEAAESGERSRRSVGQIFEDVSQELAQDAAL